MGIKTDSIMDCMFLGKLVSLMWIYFCKEAVSGMVFSIFVVVIC